MDRMRRRACQESARLTLLLPTLAGLTVAVLIGATAGQSARQAPRVRASAAATRAKLPPSIVGDWVVNESGVSVHVALTSDGRFTRTVRNAGETEVIRGRYRLDGTRLEIRPDGSDAALAFTCRLIDADQLQLTGPDGTTLRMKRVTSQPAGSPPRPAPKRPALPVSVPQPAQRSRAAGGARRSTIVLKRVWEPNEKAFTVLVPVGWKTEGGVFNVNPLTAGGPTNTLLPKTDFTVKKDAAGTVQVRWLPSYSYADFALNPQAGFGFPPGSNYRGMTVRPMPDVQGFLDSLFRSLRPQAADVRIVASGRLPELIRAYEKNFAQIGADLAPLGLRGPQADAGLREVEYVQNGVRFRESLSTVIIDNRHAAFSWTNERTVIVRVPAPEAEPWRPVLATIRRSVALNPQWLAQVLQHSRKRIQMAMETQRYVQRVAHEIVAAKGEVTGALAEQQYLYLTNQQDYVNPFTKEVERDTNEYSYRWVTRGGDVVLTNDISYDPNKDPAQKSAEWRPTKAHQR